MRRPTRGLAAAILAAPVFLASCAPQSIPLAPAKGTKLSAGDAVLVAFTTQGTQNDQFAFVVLRPVKAGTRICLSDENWTGTGFGVSDGAMIVWEADRDYPAGTVVQTLPTSNGSQASTHSYAVDIYAQGFSLTNVSGPGAQAGTFAFDPASPIQVVTVGNTGNGLTGWSSGDQFLFFQGPSLVGESGTGVAFLSALTYDMPWLTGTPTPTRATGAESYLPPGLDEGVNALALTGTIGQGGTYDGAVTTGTADGISAAINDPSHWGLAMANADLSRPALPFNFQVQ